MHSACIQQAIEDAANAANYLAPIAKEEDEDGDEGDPGVPTPTPTPAQTLTLVAGPDDGGADGGAGADAKQFQADEGATPEDGYEDMADVDDDEIVS